MRDASIDRLEIADFVQPRNEKISPQDVPNLPFIGLDAIEAHTMKLLGTKLAFELKSSAKRCYKGDVLYSRLRPYLNKVWVCDREGICSSEFIVLPENSFLHGKFLSYRLNAADFVSFANSLNAGDRPRVGFNQISKFKIPAFSFERQREIVAKIEELFSELDNGITALKTAREQLKVYRRAVLKHAFEGKLTAQWRKENTDKLESPAQLLARIQQERDTRYQQQLESWKAAVKAWEANGAEGKKPGKPTLPKKSDLNIDTATLTLGELPLGWRWLKLCDLLQNSPQNGLYKPASDYGSGGQIIRIDDFYDGSIVNTDSLKRLYVTDDEMETYDLQLGDLIVNRVNSIEYLGKSALIRHLSEPTVFESNIMRCSLIVGSVSNEYATLYLNSRLGRKELCKNAKHAVNQASINQTDVGNAFVPYCSLEEQELMVREVSVKLDSTSRVLTDINTQLKRAETIRQSILKKAFSGQLVPQDRNDEPASELLARIQAEKNKQKTAEKPKAAGKAGTLRARKPKVVS